MTKILCPTDIDFNTGASVETIDSKISVIKERLKDIKNPYHGNKRRLISDIFGLLHDTVEYNSVLDLFCGSGTFSIAARMLGKNVWANDIMAFSELGTRLFLDAEWDKELSKKDVDFLFDNDNKNKTDFVQQHWSKSFTDRECRFLDNFYKNAMELEGYKWVHALISMCHYIMSYCYIGGRLNHGQVIADLKHRMDHKRNKKYGEMSFYKEDFPLYNGLFNKNKEIQVTTTRLDACDIFSYSKQFKPDLCYIDPPYGGGQSDYMHMYSFFENYLRQHLDNPLAEGPSDKFVDKKYYYDNFSSLLVTLKDVPTLMFSYSDNSWAHIDEIITLIEKQRYVECCSEVSYQYKYRKPEASKEYIIIAQ